LAFFLAVIISSVTFLFYIRAHKHDNLHIVAVGMFGFVIANLIQMLMNGSGPSFFVVCVLMGIMRGLRLGVSRKTPAHRSLREKVKSEVQQSWQ